MIDDLKDFLDRNFQLTTIEVQKEIEDPVRRLKIALSSRIKYFIRFDLDKLLQALYRIDIKDADSDAAFDLGDIDKISMALSDLIIKRQIQKIEYSKNYRGE